VAAPALFEDAARAAGVAVRHTNGASAEKYLVETMGSGAVLFDVDGDGWVDIFLVDGGSLADPAVAARAQHHLFRNLRDGTFADVTAQSRIGARTRAPTGWARVPAMWTTMAAPICT
jgi:hypothetical protein